VGLGLLGSTLRAATSLPQGVEFFEKQVRPVLAERCYQCHGARAEKLKGGLMLDSRDGVLKGGKDGPVVVRRRLSDEPSQRLSDAAAHSQAAVPGDF